MTSFDRIGGKAGTRGENGDGRGDGAAAARESRRAFLKSAVTGTPAALVAVAGVAAGGTSAALAAETVPPGRGLRKTEHVRKYLETARF